MLKTKLVAAFGHLHNRAKGWHAPKLESLTSGTPTSNAPKPQLELGVPFAIIPNYSVHAWELASGNRCIVSCTVKVLVLGVQV